MASTYSSPRKADERRITETIYLVTTTRNFASNFASSFASNLEANGYGLIVFINYELG